MSSSYEYQAQSLPFMHTYVRIKIFVFYFVGPKKNAHEATEFIIKMFVELNTDHDRIIYPYSVCLLGNLLLRCV